MAEVFCQGVVSFVFLAGFAMMEFVTMLRRSSKALFGSSN